MPKIESYSFGNMVIDGTAYIKDVLIYPDNTILSPWWRGTGHLLEISDIKNMIRMHPEVIIAGTGANGLMRPSGEVEKTLHEKGIEFIALPTARAIDIYNEIVTSRRTGGCFHLTC